MGFVSSIILTVASIAYQYKQQQKQKKAIERAKDASAGISFDIKGQAVPLSVHFGYVKTDLYAVYWNVANSYNHSPNSPKYVSYKDDNTFWDESSDVLAEFSLFKQGKNIPLSNLANCGLNNYKKGMKDPPEGTQVLVYNSDVWGDTGTNGKQIIVKRNSLAWSGPQRTTTAAIKKACTDYWDYVSLYSDIVDEQQNYDYKTRIADDNDYIDWYKANGLNKSYSGSRHEYLYVQYTLGVGSVSQILGVEIDGKSSGYDDFENHRIHFKNGTATGCDPLISLNCDGRENALFPNIVHANACFKINRSSPQYSGIPGVSVILRGVPLYNVIKNNNTYSLSSSKSFSNNSARVLLTYLLSDIYGRGLAVDQLDLKSFYNAIKLCDVEVMSDAMFTSYNANFADPNAFLTDTIRGSLKRFTFNGSLDTSNTVRDNIATILESMDDADLVYSEGKYKLKLYYPKSDTDVSALVSMIITDEDILNKDVTVTYPSTDTKVSQTTVTFTDGNRKLVSNSKTWPETGSDVYETYLTEDSNNPLTSSLSLTGVVDPYTALAKAEYNTRVSRAKVSYTFSMGRRGLLLEPGDIIWLESATLGKSIYLKIQEINTTSEIETQITATTFNWNYLAWNVADDDPGDLLTSASTYVAPDGAPTITESSSGISSIISGVVYWDSVTSYSGVVSYRVYISDLAETYRKLIGITYNTSIELPALSAGEYIITVEVYVDGVYVNESQSFYTVAKTRKIASDDIDSNAVTEAHISWGSVSANAIAAQAVTVAAFAQNIEPVSIITSSTLPTIKSTSQIYWNGKMYNWNTSSNSYVQAITTVDPITADQISEKAISANNFAEGIEPVTIISTGSLPTVKSTQNIYWQNSLYNWSTTSNSYVKSITKVDKINADQIGVGAVFEAALANNSVTVAKIAANAVTAGKIAANAVTANTIAELAVTLAAFATGIEPVSVVSSNTLPTTKTTSTIYFENNLYRWDTNTNTYTKAIQAVDISGQLTEEQIGELDLANLAGQITSDQIGVGTVLADALANNSVTVAKIAANAVTAGKIAANAVTANTIAQAAVTLTAFASGIEPVTVSTANTLPTTKSTSSIYWNNDLYRWDSDSNAYVKTIEAVDISGQLTEDQIESINAAVLTGQITSTQITDNAITTAKIAANAVVANSIAANSIVAAKIATNAVTANAIAANSITATKIAANAVTANAIAANSVTTGLIAAGAVTADQLAANAVTANAIAANAVTAAAIAANTITAGDVAANAITSSELAANSVTAAAIAADAVTANAIAANAVTADAVAANAIVAVNIQAAAVIAGKLAANAVVANSIAANAVVAGKIAANAVTATTIAANSIIADNIIANAVTTAAIASAAVSSDQIAANAIIASKIAADAVTANAIAANAVVAGSIAANAVTAATIAADAITAAKIATNAVTADALAANSVLAVNVNAAAITGVKIAANAINSYHITANSINASVIQTNAITSGKIAAGAVSADQIAANAITASKLVVSDFSNMIRNSDMLTDDEGWNFGTGASRVAVPNNMPSTYGFKFGVTTTSTGRYTAAATKVIPVEGGRDYSFAMTSRASGTSPFFSARLRISWRDANNSEMSATFLSVDQTTVSPVLTTKILTAPDTAGAVAIQVLREATNNEAGDAYICNPTMRRATNGELIVDGTITGTHINVNTINSYHIQANSINANVIQTDAITSGKIKAGAVGADEIASNAIIASKIAISDFNNLVVDSDHQDGANTYVETSSIVGSFSVLVDSNAAAGTVDRQIINLVRVANANSTAYYGVVQNSKARGSVNDAYEYLCEGSAYVNSSATIIHRIFWYNGSTQLSYTNMMAADRSSSGWYSWSVDLTPPANATSFALAHYISLNSTASTLKVGKVKLTRKTAGELIVDGTITGTHIKANTINSYHIAANSIYANVINVSNLRTNILTANSVNAAAINVTSLSAISANIGNVVIDTANIANLAVETVKIANNAVTVGTVSTWSNVAVTQNSGTDWSTVKTLSLTGNAGDAIIIIGYYNLTADPDTAGEAKVMWRGTTIPFSAGAFDKVYDYGNGGSTIGWVMKNPEVMFVYSSTMVSGTNTIDLQWHRTTTSYRVEQTFTSIRLAAIRMMK